MVVVGHTVVQPHAVMVESCAASLAQLAVFGALWNYYRGKEGQRKAGREGGREGGRKGGQEEERKGGRQEGREGGRERGKEGGKERMEGGRKEGRMERDGGREGGGEVGKRTGGEERKGGIERVGELEIAELKEEGMLHKDHTVHVHV